MTLPGLLADANLQPSRSKGRHSTNWHIPTGVVLRLFLIIEPSYLTQMRIDTRSSHVEVSGSLECKFLILFSICYGCNF